MKFVRACALLWCALAPGLLKAAPVTISNPSFEIQTPELTAGQWTNNLAPSWTGAGGASNASAFMEWLGLSGENGTDTLGMELSYDVWQDLSATYQTNTLYTLTVGVGNRSGATVVGNQSVYGLAAPSNAVMASGVKDASSQAVGTVADAPALTFDTFADPCAAGQTIRVLLQARGAGRSHFDNVRLDAVAATAGGRPEGTLNVPTAVTTTTAAFSGTVISIGSAAPSVTFYWDTADRGANPALWASSVAVPGTQSGAFSANASGLTASTTYFVRARLTNASGAVWAAPCRSFTTSATPPVVLNVAATSITGSGATVGANVTSTGGQTPDVTIYYGTADGGTIVSSWASSVSIPGLSGTATRALSGLSPATLYYFRAYAQNSSGSDWADSTSTFTTIGVGPPSVENRATDNITGTSAVLNGEVTNAGGDPPVVTFFWGPSDGGTTPASWANSRALGPDSGDFSSMVQGLTPLTTYYFRSRAVNAAGTAWAPDTRTFTTISAVPVNVIINEIHYDPADPTKPQEFIEFYNPTASAINMGNWTIDSGVSYTFPAGTSIAAGGYKVVAQDIPAFTAAFPGAGAPLGPWNGQLSNSGETVRLNDAAGNKVDEVDYKAGFPWPTAPKGGGVSCELIHPSLNNDLGGNWRAAGSPAVTTYVPFASQWRWRRGVAGDTGEPASQFTAWRALNFTEPAVPATNAQWATNTAPFGYGENDGVAGETENTTPLPDMAGGALYTSVYLRKIFTIPAGQVPSFIQVKARCDDGCIVWINGVYVGAIRPNAAIGTGHHYYNTLAQNAPEPPPVELLPVMSAAALNLVAGNNLIAIHAMNTSTTSSDFFIDAEVTQSFGGTSGASPNAPNSVLAPNLSQAPPAIRNVETTPKQPAAGQPVVVTATITDPDNVGAVTLSYQIVDPGSYIRKADAAYSNPANWISLPMNDSGAGGDLAAGDGVFSATIPASVQTNRRLIRYRITAADSLNNSVTVPFPDDDQPNFAYFVYNGVPSWTGAFRPAAFAGFPATAAQTFPASLIGSIEPYHLIALDSDVALCLYNGPTDSTAYQGAFVYEGKVYDHITFNIRGIGSTRVSGKNKLAFKFNRARDFRARDNWGRQYSEDWNSFGLDANASPWAALHRGSAGVEEAASYRIFELGGINSLHTNYAHLRIIRKAVESPPAGTPVTDATAGGSVDGQYSSDLWGLYMVLEPTEGNFLDERSLPDGNIYAIEGNGGDKKHQGATQPTNTSDWDTFRTQLIQTGQTETWYRANMDLDSLYTFIGLSRLVGNVDVRDGDNYRYYHRSSDNRWQIMPYDLDMMFIAASHWVSQVLVDGVVTAGVPHSFAPIKRIPAIAQEYRNRCRELLSLMASDAAPSGGQIGQLIDEYAQMVNPTGVALTWADVDAAMWNLHPRSAGAGANNGQTNHRGNFYRATFTDARGAGTGSVASTYPRTLSDPDADGFSDHEGLMAWFTNFATNTYPAVNPAATPPVTPWTRRPTTSGPNAAGSGGDTYVYRQKGYGYKYLEWESLYGGHFAAFINPPAGTAIGDLDAAGNTLYPVKPVITYTGTAGYPVNDVRLHSSDFADPQGADSISAIQWRVGEISAPGIPLYDSTKPRIYEIESVWTSLEIATAVPTGIPDVRVPASVLRAGHTYRARVRHKDNTGRWSYWSEPLQFVSGVPDVSPYAAALRISEINYNPGAVTAAESSAPGWNALWNNEDFEFIEVRNVSASAIDLTDVRFTKGIDFDFPPSFSLAAGGSAVIVKNPAAFAIRYPGVTPTGSYGTDSLSNSGEDIKLSYGAGASIIEFAYDDVAPWPASPDGGGFTLVLKTPSKAGLNHADPLEWRASGLPYGTPGTVEGTGGYDTWAASYPGLGGRDADDDRDGLSNRLEYALAGNPQNSAPSRTPTAGTTSAGGLTYATLTFIRRSDAPDLTFSVQFSDELLTWNLPAVMVSSTDNGNGTLTQVWRSTNPVSTARRLFGRVIVSE